MLFIRASFAVDIAFNINIRRHRSYQNIRQVCVYDVAKRKENQSCFYIVSIFEARHIFMNRNLREDNACLKNNNKNRCYCEKQVREMFIFAKNNDKFK